MNGPLTARRFLSHHAGVTGVDGTAEHHFYVCSAAQSRNMLLLIAACERAQTSINAHMAV